MTYYKQRKGAKADLYYGATGTHKTSNIGKAAVWAMKKYGKPTRLVSADGGGWEPIQSLVDAGIVIPWQVRDREHQVESIDQACQGYWPLDPADPMSPLEAPFVVTYYGVCPNCGHRMQAKDPSVKPRQQEYPCTQCKTPVVITSHRTASGSNNLSEIAVVAVEGLTSLGDLILLHLEKRKASLSEDPSYTWEDGSSTYAGGNKSYYGFVQARLYDFVMKSNMLPVEKVIWTALEGRGVEELTRAPIYGPAIAGKAATGKAGGWFGAMLHFEVAEKTGATEADATLRTGVTQVITENRMYLRNHLDAITKIPFPAKTRAPYQYAHLLPDWMETDVEKLYNKTDELQAKASTEIDAIKAGVVLQEKR